MNHYINPTKTALTIGAFAGGLHLVWSILIALGWAQALVDFKLWVHMISVPILVKPFELSTAATLVIVTSIVGYVVGHIFALIWNRMHRT